MYVALRDPLATIKHLSFHNLRKLLKAIDSEPRDQIIENIDRYLIGNSMHELRFFDQAPLDRFIKKVQKLTASGPVAIFVTHEATRTGAPMIIKKLARHCQDRLGFTPIFILCRGGEIAREFTNSFLSYCIRNRNEGASRDQELELLFKQLYKATLRSNIIINSVESRFILPHVRKAGFSKVTYLVHEMGNLYQKGEWQIINEHASHVIFPAKAIEQKAKENSAFDKATLHIAAQGLLKPELLEGNHNVERQKIREELNIQRDAIIVLSCGSTIARKGIDIFAFTAISSLSQYRGKRPLYFLWLGNAPPNYFQKWVSRDVEQSGWSSQIKFIGARRDTIPYFLASDIFFMTSRGDPFPCVVQEAMASGLPIVGFHNAGGYPEMLYAQNSYLARYGDIAAAAKIIANLAENELDFTSQKKNTIEFARRHFDFTTYSEYVLNIAFSRASKPTLRETSPSY